MILKLHSDQTIDVIDFKRTKPQQLQDDSLLIEWLEKADQQKRQMFSVLCGSTYISHFRSLTFRQIMESVLDSSCLRDFFPLVEKRYHIETRNIKNYHGTFEDTAHSLLLLYTFQICYSFVNKQQEPLRSHGFEAFFRENKINNKKEEVKRVEKLAPEDQVLKNKHQNKEFEKIFSLIGEIVHKYDDDERYRKGHLKIHNDKHPAKSWPVQGKTM